MSRRVVQDTRCRSVENTIDVAFVFRGTIEEQTFPFTAVSKPLADRITQGSMDQDSSCQVPL